MQRISGTTAKANANGNGKTGFVDLDSALGILGTIVSAAYMNAVQEEIATVIESMGMALNSGDNNQLYQAIQAMIGTMARGMFAPEPTVPASMMVAINAGYVPGENTVTAVAAQTTPAFIAPAANPRIDRIVISRATGAMSVVAGAPAAAPVPPAVPAGTLPVAQVAIPATAVAITAAMITDERDLPPLGLGALAFEGIGQGLEDDGTGNLRIKLPDTSLVRGPAGLQASLHGQCRLILSGSNLLLKPYNGNKLIIGGVPQTIPAAGVFLAPAGLNPNTLYYIYDAMVGGAMTLVPSTTGHTTDPTTGIEVMIGDAAKTLVGMAYVIGGPSFADSNSQRLVFSYFNRLGKGVFLGSVSGTTSSSAAVELNTSGRVQILSWADECTSASCIGTASINAATYWCWVVPGFDGVFNGAVGSIGTDTAENTPNAGMSMVGSSVSQLSEGYHYITSMGGISSASGVVTIIVGLIGTVRG